MGLMDRARKRLSNIQEKKYDGQVSFWSPHIVKDLENDPGDRIRMICPPYLDNPDMEPWVESEQYMFNLGGKWLSSHAPSFFGLPDPIAEQRQALYRMNTEDAKTQARALGSKHVYLCLIIDLNEPEKGVQVFNFGNSIMETLTVKLLDEDYNIFWDLEKGHDIKIKRTGEKLETKYNVDLAPRSSSLMESIQKSMGDNFKSFPFTQDELLAQANGIDLAAFVKVETAETLREMLEGKYDPEVAKTRRDERDAVHGRPMPLFITTGRELTAEAVDNRRRVEAEDAENDDPLFAAPPGDDIPFEGESEPTEDKFSWVGKTVSFELDEDDGRKQSFTGKVKSLELEEDEEVLIIDVEGEEFVIPPEYVEEVKQASKPRRKFAKPEKTEKASSIMDRVKQIRDSDD